MTWLHELRWRDRRQTLPARRRRRRHRRRDVERAGGYDPAPLDTSSASRGVRKRLGGAVVALAVTVGCITVGVGTSMATFAGLFAMTLGVSSLGAAVALILSARDEERVHDVAGRLDDSGDDAPTPSSSEQNPDRERPLQGTRFDGTDGWVESTRSNHSDPR